MNIFKFIFLFFILSQEAVGNTIFKDNFENPKKWQFISDQVMGGMSSGKVDFFNENNKDNKYHSTYVDYASTCCLLIRKEVFDNIGLMDEKYFVYFDDTDFLFRVKKEGVHKIYYDSQITLFHKVGSLTKSLTKICIASGFLFPKS